jgi:tRNA threonylcarbamoyl adenosine modification protein (Sua5/YciO/YrdC/YwlC family)
MSIRMVTPEQAVDLLQSGHVGVMPTDTVYGLAARAKDIQATEKLYKLKHREHKPGTLIAASTNQLRLLGVAQNDIDKVAKWWPGALSAVLPIDGQYLHQGLGDLAMRVVADDKIRAILEQTGPLITSSANHPGKPGSTTIDEAISYFGDQVDFYVDGGDLSGRSASTIVKVMHDDTIIVLRQGAVQI